MPFRIRFSVALLLTIIILVLVGPLVVPISPLSNTGSPRDMALENSRFVQADGLEVHYLEAGSPDAAPLLLLHGYGYNVLSWRDNMEELAQVAHTVAFDRPGFGLTERPAAGSWEEGDNPYSPEGQAELVISVMDALGLESAILLGHNNGAVAALDVALNHPDRVDALILEGPAVFNVGGRGSGNNFIINTPHMRRIGPLFMRQMGGTPGQGLILSNWADGQNADARSEEAFALNFRVNDWDKALWELSRASHEVQFLDRLGSITQPALVISGSADGIVDPADARRLAEQLSNATAVTLDGCGHIAHEECAAEFNRTVTDWLQEIPLPDGR